MFVLLLACCLLLFPCVCYCVVCFMVLYDLLFWVVLFGLYYLGFGVVCLLALLRVSWCYYLLF